jgi:secreted PhoX family phosphatase
MTTGLGRSRLGRRSFLTHGAFAAGAVTVAGPLQALLARGRDDDDDRRRTSPDYGPLEPVLDQTTGLPLLMLPHGFRYLSFGWTRDPLNDGSLTPGSHDGMAAFSAWTDDDDDDERDRRSDDNDDDGRRRGRGRVYLIRNHEVGDGPDAFGPSSLAYDPEAGGGTTTLEFDSHHGRYVAGWPSLSGTVRNCAGGPTPWGSWLTCEETTVGPAAGNDLTKKHGYIFEVPVFGMALPVPYREMGRFSHEAVAIDPRTGFVYETEDTGNAGLYRFRPRRRGSLGDGGTLEMLGIKGRPQYDTAVNQTGEWLEVEWHEIDTPDPDLAGGAPSVYMQGFNKGGARFARLEGAWYGNRRIYFLSTSGGNVGQGQIFEYDPRKNRLRLLFESPSADVLNAPDNMCVSPRGGLVLCEDGSGTEYMHGLTTEGEIFRFVQNSVDLRTTPVNGFNSDYRGSEFAGACYSPDGKWLFFNIQSPGITFAITGPWGKGAL